MNSITLESIKNNLRRYQPDLSPKPEQYKSASVLIPFHRIGDELFLVFMKRPDKPEPHGGQISFPGGGKDETDKNDLETAIRETHEEYGIDPEQIEIWGRLKRRGTRASCYWISPFVGQIASDIIFNPNSEEVDRLIFVPFKHLLEEDSYSVGLFPWKGGQYRSDLFQYRDDVIWGLTAKILASFILFLKTGKETE